MKWWGTAAPVMEGHVGHPNMSASSTASTVTVLIITGPHLTDSVEFSPCCPSSVQRKYVKTVEAGEEMGRDAHPSPSNSI